MEESYLLPAQQATAAFKDRGSRFIGLVFRTETRDSVDQALAEVRQAHPDARHHCYGWRLLPNSGMQMASDDGEPRHSAGDPILGQILSRNLYGTLVVVVRYFGGTKLGVPGLIHAYRSAASLALDEAGVWERKPGEWYELTFPYEATATVQTALAQLKLEPSASSFNNLCSHRLWIDHLAHANLMERIQSFPEINLRLLGNTPS